MASQLVASNSHLSDLARSSSAAIQPDAEIGSLNGRHEDETHDMRVLLMDIHIHIDIHIYVYIYVL